MYCRKCGEMIDDEAIICPKCGVSQQTTQVSSGATGDDNGGFGWFALACCIPIVGIVLWIVWKDQRPNTVSSLKKGLIVGIIITVIGYILSFCFGIFLGAVEEGLMDDSGYEYQDDSYDEDYDFNDYEYDFDYQ